MEVNKDGEATEGQQEEKKVLTPDDPQFTLEHQWQLFLKRVDLKGKKMPAEQYREMKRAFMGACGEMLILFRDDLSNINQEDAIVVFNNMIKECGAWWQEQQKFK